MEKGRGMPKMKNKILVIVFACLALTATTAYGKITIHNVFTKHDYINAVVEYTNTSEQTYTTVTIKCKALDPDDKVLNINSRSIFDHSVGPISPGFNDTLKVPISLNGAIGTAVSCNVFER